MPTIYLLLRRVMSRAARSSIPLLLGLLVLIMALATITVYIVERAPNPEFRTLGDSLWWVIVTMSTVGYGDKVPITVEGRLTASVIMVAGPVLLATFAASVGTTFYDEWQKGIKGMIRITAKEHIVICGWNATGDAVIDELRQSGMFDKIPITIVDATIDSNPSTDSRTSFVRGFPSEVKVLEQANIREAKYAIVVAKDKIPTADQQTVLTVLAIKSINPQIYICAELNDNNNEAHLRRAGCDSIVNTSSLTSGLLALSLENPDVNAIIGELASFRGNEVYRIKVPEGIEGNRFGDMLNAYKTNHDAIVIGVERDGKPILNPSASLELKVSDYLLVLSEENPR